MVIILEDLALKVIRETEMSSFQAADGIETDLSYFIFCLFSFDHIDVAGFVYVCKVDIFIGSIYSTVATNKDDFKKNNKSF